MGNAYGALGVHVELNKIARIKEIVFAKRRISGFYVRKIALVFTPDDCFAIRCIAPEHYA